MGKRPPPPPAAPLAVLLAPLFARGRAGALGTVAALPDLEPIDHGPSLPCEVLVSEDADALMRASEAAPPGAVFVHIGTAPPAPTGISAQYQMRVLWRPLSGDLLAPAAFTDMVVARLHGIADTPATYITAWSTAVLPQVALGLHARTLAAAPLPRAPPLPPRPHAPPDADTVGLALRLQLLEDRLLAVNPGPRAGGGDALEGPGFEPPTDRHPWPRAEPDRDPSGYGLYDRRPDDAVLDEADAGKAFLARFGLLGDAPDYAGAVAALNATPVGLDTDSAPDVTIVIPVFGQLSYTLNAIDSLLRHASRYAAEIVVVDDCSADGATSLHIPAIARVITHRTDANRGFVASCNEGAALARGRFVLLLNNDTRVVPGWLDRLIDSFAAFPRAGLVGSKMIFPDGRLQEAGNIVWRDGSVWNFGRGDDPNRPQYCHARPTDYVSGCSVALPTSLWRQLHGLDPAFAPAYAEDADLAQRVLQAGREVWFQPASRVVHYEGRTSGTQTDTGVKAYQVANLRRLFLRWRRNFETHRFRGDAPYLERERVVRRRILVVDAVTPTPDQDAGSVQTVLALRCCQAAGYKAVFVPEDNWLFVPGYTAALQAAGVECAYAPFDTAFGPFIRRAGHLFDAVIVYRMQVLARCIDLLRMHAPRAPLIFHVADLHYLRTERQATLEANPAGAAAAAAMKDTELDLVRRADCTVTHSTAEAAILAHEAPGAPVVVWPLMMEVFGTSAPFADRRDVCFLGGYRHPPNEDAAIHFAAEVLPLLRSDLPALRFVAAGANPSDRVQALAGDQVEVTGQVPDLAELFDRCRVFVCPLRVGAGAKGKIASALAHGIPVVSTSVGIEGVGLVDGEHVLVADTPAEMAAAVLRLYCDPDLWERLSQAGQAFIRYQASLEMGRRRLDQAVETAWRHKLDLRN